MKREESDQLWAKLFVAFPDTRRWLRRQKDANATYAIWCETLSDVELSDGLLIVGQLISGSLDMPPAYDREKLPQIIRRAANDLRYTREERSRQARYHNQSRGSWNRLGNDSTGTIAVLLGRDVRQKKITAAENEKRMAELMAWDKGGNAPDWLSGYTGRKLPPKPLN